MNGPARLPRWIGGLAACTVTGFVPWLILLAVTIPARARTSHYDLAWVGFDTALCGLLATLAALAFHNHRATGTVATTCATLFVVDAWFDILTSDSGRHQAILLAAFGELPLAALCALAARRANHHLRHVPAAPSRPMADAGAGEPS